MQLDRHNIGNGSTAVVVPVCHRDVLESGLSRASSRLALGVCVVTSEWGDLSVNGGMGDCRRKLTLVGALASGHCDGLAISL